MSLITWSSKEIIHAVNCYVSIGDSHKIFKRINIDSRSILKGDLFIAINGKNYKGISFLNEIIINGSRGIMIEWSDIRQLNINKLIKKNIICFVVENTVNALGQLAAYHRQRVQAKIIAITGSVGKTTTRQMINKIVAQKYSTTATLGNMNNCIGVPLSIFKIEKHHEFAILELGMNKLGEIKKLSHICQPDIGIITNVAHSHLETLGSIENIAKAKSEIIQHIKPEGILILNNDDFFVKSMSGIRSLNTVSFGMKNEADIKGENISITSSGIKFVLKTLFNKVEIQLLSHSKALLSNSLAASAVAISLGLSSNMIKKSLESFKHDHGRMYSIQIDTANIEIIDDTYNSNPISLRNAIETISILKLKKNYLAIAIIGDMLELGKKSKLMHYKAGQFIAESKINFLYVTGRFAKYIVKGAISAGISRSKTYIGSKQNIINHIEQNIQTKCIILIKGSRSMQMEQILKSLIIKLTLTSDN